MRSHCLLIAAAATLAAQGTVEQLTVHGKSLENNLIGDSPDRNVSVYLPKSYATNKSRRYPVVYFLHGYTDSDEKWFRTPKHWIQFPAVLDKAAIDFIVVMPNAYNAFQGSLYSTSVTTGDWETFVAKDLVAAIDAKYRTIAKVTSRGIAGHSMGGYGAIRLGLRHPDVFSAVYMLSPCCMESTQGASPKAESVATLADFAKQDFGTKATLARAAAWSPNPSKPPLYLDLPTGDAKADVLARWSANAPLALVHQYAPNLKRLRALGFDAGDQDKSIFAACQALHGILGNYGIAHDYAEYEGNHTNRVAERIEKVAMPFFAKSLLTR
jgi:S-formylglutathione hydrolase FrmB